MASSNEPLQARHAHGQLKAIARRRWRIAAMAFTVPCVVTLGLVAFLPSMYESQALVLVEPPGAGAGTEVNAARIEQLTKENLSQPRLVALVAELGESGGDAAAQALRRDVDIETERVSGPSGQTSIGVSVRARGFDPDRSARIANALASFYLEAERARLAQDASAIEAQIRDARTRLDEEEARLKEFEAQHLRELPEQVQVHLASLEGLNAQLEMIRMDRTRTLEHVRAQNEQSAAQPAPSARPDPTEAELTRLRGSLGELRARYTDAHPDVISMSEKIERLAAHRNATPAPTTPSALAGHADDIDAALKVWAKQERALEARIADVQHEALNAARRGQERAILLPSYDAARTAYTDLLRRYDELQARRGADGDRVPFRIVEEALPARQAVLPNRTRLAGLGLILAFLACGASVWLREQVDRTFHTSSELRAFTSVPVLGHIPRIITAADLRRRHALAVLGTLVFAAVMVALLFAVHTVASDGALFRVLTRTGGP